MTPVDHCGTLETAMSWPGRNGSTGRSPTPDQMPVGRLVRNDGGMKGGMDIQALCSRDAKHRRPERSPRGRDGPMALGSVRV